MDRLKPLIIKATNYTPYVNFDPDTGEFIIKGISIPEHSESFYLPIYNWIDQYLENPQPVTVLKCFINYFNTSSAVRILDILKKLKKLENTGKKIIIKWYIHNDDPDMLEVGQDYQSILDIPFEFIFIDQELDGDEKI